MKLSLTGHDGTLRWGYRTAATLGPWRYDGHWDSGTLTAQVVRCDEYALAQAPLVAVAHMGRAIWKWSVTSLQINDATLTVSVARQE